MWSLNKRMLQFPLCSIGLFALTFVLLGFAVDQIWFREDDLGTILGGIIRSWDDLIRVFSADCRSFITPANYQRTMPNVISGFLRPMQNVVFSVVYYFWGVEPRAYYLTHVAFHALNAVLFFLLSYMVMQVSWVQRIEMQRVWMPLVFSFAAGLLFSFYPDVAWLPWIGTVQNSLATFFLLLMGLLLLGQYRWLAALAFLCSLLSRESGILLPFWLFLGAYLLQDWVKLGKPFLQKITYAIQSTWMFFLANVIYALMRLWAFGCATLPRTMRNVFLRYPWLAEYFGNNVQVASTAAGMQDVVQASAGVADHVVAVVPVTAAIPTLLQAFLDRFSAIFHSWFQSIFNIYLKTQGAYWLALLGTLGLIIFLVYAYRNNLKLLFWLCCGTACVLWPGVLAYPSPRYINLVYPFVIFIIVYGVALFCSSVKNNGVRYGALAIFCIVAGLASLHGLYQNRTKLHSAASDRSVYKKRFDDFFAKHTFDRDARFVLLSSPFVSDIQSIFQAYLGNLDTVVIFDPFATFAEHKVMGCRKDYRVTGVPSEMVSIAGGYRLISHDKDHCGWWLRFSDFPIAWSAQHRAYEWMKDPYQEGVWYDCSIGKFKINGLVDADCVYDISFVFDEQWVDEKTVFVAWDSGVGEYFLVERDELSLL